MQVWEARNSHNGRVLSFRHSRAVSHEVLRRSRTPIPRIASDFVTASAAPRAALALFRLLLLLFLDGGRCLLATLCADQRQGVLGVERVHSNGLLAGGAK